MERWLKMCCICCDAGGPQRPRRTGTAPCARLRTGQDDGPLGRAGSASGAPATPDGEREGTRQQQQRLVKESLSRQSCRAEQPIVVSRVSGEEVLADIRGFTTVGQVREHVAALLGIAWFRTQIIDPRNGGRVLEGSEELASASLQGVPQLQVVVLQKEDGAAEYATRRLKRELKRDLSEFVKTECASVVYTLADHAGISVSVPDDDVLTWNARIQGPQGSPYEAGIFDCKVYFPIDYPYMPPSVFFTTKVFHCNVSSTGLLCADIFGDEWSPALTGCKILLCVSALLADPNPCDPVNKEAAELYLSDKDAFDARAREWVSAHAMTNAELGRE